MVVVDYRNIWRLIFANCSKKTSLNFIFFHIWQAGIKSKNNPAYHILLSPTNRAAVEHPTPPHPPRCRFLFLSLGSSLRHPL